MPLVAVAVEHHAHGKTGAIHVFAQRAQIGGQLLRQHRHDAVGKVAGVAALIGFAIQRRSRRHIMRDVGNGDDDDMPALVLRIVIRAGPHRVVVIARILRIDGDERHVAQIGAAARIDGLSRFGLLDHFVREFRRNAVRMNGDHADRLGLAHAAEAFRDAGTRQAWRRGPRAARPAPARCWQRCRESRFSTTNSKRRLAVDRCDAAAGSVF